jgi:hypothetical protein
VVIVSRKRCFYFFGVIGVLEAVAGDQQDYGRWFISCLFDSIGHNQSPALQDLQAQKADSKEGSKRVFGKVT